MVGITVSASLTIDPNTTSVVCGIIACKKRTLIISEEKKR